MINFKNSNTRFLLGCVGAGVAALGAFGWFAYSDLQEMSDLEEKSSGLRSQIARADGEIATTATVEDRVLVLREKVKEYVAILPDDAEIHAFVDKLTQFEKDSGVVVTKLDDTQARQRQTQKGKSAQAFESIRYKMQLQGTAAQLLAFMDRLENHYDRFVSFPTLSIAAFQDRSSGARDEEVDPTSVVRQHSINLELETYVYNPKKKSSGQVEIRSEAKKLERLRQEGVLKATDATAILARYEIRPRADRRDPFVDPRLSLAENSRIPESERRRQLEMLEDMKARLTALRDAFSQEATEENLVKRMQAVEKNNRELGVFAAEVAKAAEGVFTVPDYVKDFRLLVEGPVRTLLDERNQAAPSAFVPIQDIEERITKMERACEIAQWDEVVRLHDEARQLASRVEKPESVAALMTRADTFQQMANVHLRFGKMKLAFGGCVTFDDDPAHAVIIIDGKSFSPGEAVADGLTIRQITPAEVVFDFEGHRVARRHIGDVQ